MRSHHFDHLAKFLGSRTTRRTSLGFFAAVSLLSHAPGGENAEAKKRRKKRKKKRRGGGGPEPGPGPDPAPEPCLELGVACVAGSSQTCCAGLACDQTVVAGTAGSFCCDPEGTPCAFAEFERCCSRTCDSLVGGGTCAPCRGRSCDATRPCCGGETCSNGYCGGCRDRGTSCISSDQCCFSDCTGGACFSALGGRCARDADCRTCYQGGTCSGACMGGVCTV